ncbi:MAG TPA: response regulator [Paludibaculum sp.]|jgi:CheY-like chemotaxis protein
MATVLLVEDNPDQRILRRMILERAGHTVLDAANAHDALVRVRAGGVGCVLMDLGLPRTDDGLQLITELSALDSRLPVVVLSGCAHEVAALRESGAVAAALSKPVGTERLLRTLERLTATFLLFLTCFVTTLSAQTREFAFQVRQPAEIVADLVLDAPNADWSKPGREASLATLSVDGKAQQNLMVFGGARTYSVFLGQLDAGPHTLKVERHATYSATGAGLRAVDAKFRESKDDFIAHAPILLARANTLGQFTDVPLLAYCTRGKDAAGAYLEYTVIFSNEDGGTSTRDLMARWGRTTDIEYIYRVWLNAAGAPVQTLIQTKDHVDVPYSGTREGSHPILMPVTDNNMVAPAPLAGSPIRYQLAPVLTELGGGSREKVMDAAPFTYRIAAEELEREGKLRPAGAFDGEKISDPRNYLVVEFQTESKSAAVQLLVRGRASQRWYGSSNGLAKSHIERDGWARTAIELPPGTRLAALAEIGAQCLSLRDVSRQPVPKNGTCSVGAFGRIFLLGPDYAPLPALAPPAAGWRLKAGEMMSAPLQ